MIRYPRVALAPLSRAALLTGAIAAVAAPAVLTAVTAAPPIAATAAAAASTIQQSSGTFTVDGKTTTFKQVYATLETDPATASRQYLMLLVTDVAVAPADRTPARLLALSKAGTLRAIRIRWTYGTDSLAVVPYHPNIAESGRAHQGLSTLNLTRLDDTRVDAEFKSKMLGQSWHFNAIVKSPIAKGSTATLEPDADAPVESAAAPSGSGDATALKRQLGAMKYEFTEDAFFQAIGDRNAAAVSLFLKAGMSPNVKNDQGRFALNHAVLFCAQDGPQSTAVIVALLNGKANVKSQDPDNKTTALVGAVQSCQVEAVEALIKAGSDLTAKSAGGMTALQLAEIFQKADIVAALKKAGAK